MTKIQEAQIVISKIDSAIAMAGGLSMRGRRLLEAARSEYQLEVQRLRKSGHEEGV